MKKYIGLIALVWIHTAFGSSEVLRVSAGSYPDLLKAHYAAMPDATRKMMAERYSRSEFLYDKFASLAFSRLSGPDRKVLDIGTGTGFMAKLLKKQGDQVTAIDPDLDTVSWGYAQGNFKDVELLPGKLEDLPETYDNYFDLAVFGSYLVFLPWESFYASLKRFLKPGGYAYLFFAEEDFEQINWNGQLEFEMKRNFEIKEKQKFSYFTLVVLEKPKAR